MIFPTAPTAHHISERKKSAPRNSSMPQIFASGRSEKNTTNQFGSSGSCIGICFVSHGVLPIASSGSYARSMISEEVSVGSCIDTFFPISGVHIMSSSCLLVSLMGSPFMREVSIDTALLSLFSRYCDGHEAILSSIYA